jgi:putative ABC transport system ATP-binding protein
VEAVASAADEAAAVVAVASAVAADLPAADLRAAATEDRDVELEKARLTNTAKKPIVRLTDVTKVYVMGHAGGGGGLLSRRTHVTSVTVHALRGVSVDFYPGEYVAIMGASGSGKSTMLNLLGCLDRPTSGEYFLGGRDVSGLNDDELSEIRSRYLGFIFQSYNLVQQYTVLENIQLPLTYQGNGEISKEAEERSVQVAGLVGLADRLDHRPSQLSGGQQQRVAIARSLINDPYIILADEPTGNLDTKTSHEIMGMLEKLNEEAGKTIIMVTHEDDIAANAKRIIRMRDGLIIDDGPSPRMQQAQADADRLATAAVDGVSAAWNSEFQIDSDDAEMGRPEEKLAH